MFITLSTDYLELYQVQRNERCKSKIKEVKVKKNCIRYREMKERKSENCIRYREMKEVKKF